MDRQWDRGQSIICLVGGGQEINTCEAGISVLAGKPLTRSFGHWQMFISSRLYLIQSTLRVASWRWSLWAKRNHHFRRDSTASGGVDAPRLRAETVNPPS